MTSIAPEPVTTLAPADDEVHVVCCNPDVALCGTDVAGLPWGDGDEETTCIVCRDLEHQNCPRCGI
ncbi:hypothetical protein [Streptomyces antibioticus]|uniref:hypothetical protein n=1 Tax=Streptomyces antibioticus TaxID=1890 RepID=UPI0036CB3287